MSQCTGDFNPMTCLRPPDPPTRIQTRFKHHPLRDCQSLAPSRAGECARAARNPLLEQSHSRRGCEHLEGGARGEVF
eukprot:1256266-Rhodomonas_salina.2